MIKSHTLEDALDERPSKSQLRKLIVGDRVLLRAHEKLIECKVLFVREEDLVGVIEKGCEVVPGSPIYILKNGDLLSFTTKKIFRVFPNEARIKLLPFMLVTHIKLTHEVFVIHTQYPRVIGIIETGNKVTAREAVWIDEPADYDAVAPKLLKEMGEWYFYNYVNKK